MPPLGWSPPSKRHSNSEQKSRARRQAEQMPENCKMLSAPDFPRTCRIKLVADDLFDEEIGKGKHDKTIGYMIGVISRANEIFEQTDWLEHQNCSFQARVATKV